MRISVLRCALYGQTLMSGWQNGLLRHFCNSR
jgi:hypothetical protein